MGKNSSQKSIDISGEGKTSAVKGDRKKSESKGADEAKSANEDEFKASKSLSSLFQSSSKVDESVNALFQSSAGPIKRVIKPRTVINIPKRKEPQPASSDSDAEEDEEAPPQKKVKRSKQEENFDLEANYFEKILAEEKPAIEEPKIVASETEKTDSPETDSEDESDNKPEKAKEAKALDLKEKELVKAESTIFIGNVSSKVITDKKVYKAFKKLFSKFGKVESVRFRSISFNEALPRKVAFVQQKFHDSRDTVNAYIVYQNKEDSKKALEMNSTVFAENHIRVDHVAHPSKQDNKRCIFVGNLDFDEKEESLWQYFESLGEIEYVRIVRDSKTNLGKGFAYVQFKDFLSVSKALMWNEKPLTTSDKKRKLRISRCKNIRPTNSNAQSNNRKSNLTDQQRTKLGRAKKILGKADRSGAGKVVVEGARASKGQRVSGIKNGLGKFKKPRTKKPRIRERTTNFKKQRDEISKSTA